MSSPPAYLYDRQAKTLRKLYDARPELAGAPLVPMRPVTIRSRDGLDLVCYLTRPADAEMPGALVLLVHGGPWARDMFGLNPNHQWLANRGYSVLSVNFRGSTGFGKAFVNAGDVEWGRRMDDDLLDAVGWAVATGAPTRSVSPSWAAAMAVTPSSPA
jgi:dipeptidyl aminopeptidase/acylaminoacyl peptidase